MSKVYTCGRCFAMIIFLVLFCLPALAQKVRKYEATVFFVSGFKDKGVLEAVNAQGIMIHDGSGSRLISPSGIRKILIRPYRSGGKSFFSGAIAGVAGAGLSHAIRTSYQQGSGHRGLPLTLLAAGAATGTYFWLMNSLIRTVVFRRVNEPGIFEKYRPRLERFASGPQDAV